MHGGYQQVGGPSDIGAAVMPWATGRDERAMRAVELPSRAMSLDSFHHVDLIVDNDDDPPLAQRFIAVNTGGWLPEDEALLTLQAIIKFTMFQRRAADQVGPGRPSALELVTIEESPDTLRRWLNDRGVECTTIDGEARSPSVGRPSGFADDGHGRPALDLPVEASARRFAEEYDLPWPPTQAALAVLDDVIGARRAEACFGPDDDVEEA